MIEKVTFKVWEMQLAGKEDIRHKVQTEQRNPSQRATRVGRRDQENDKTESEVKRLELERWQGPWRPSKDVRDTLESSELRIHLTYYINTIGKVEAFVLHNKLGFVNSLVLNCYLGRFTIHHSFSIYPHPDVFTFYYKTNCKCVKLFKPLRLNSSYNFFSIHSNF